MAQIEYDGRLEAPGRVQRIVYMGGAVLSVGLVLGFCIWGYRLAVRDMAAIPVVRAIEGPMRVAPADPGGTVSEHQGLSVNAVAAAGVAGDPADRLVLAPRPVDLTVEDTAGSFAAPAAPVSARSDQAPGLTIAAAGPNEALPQDQAIAAAIAEATEEDLLQLDQTSDVVPLAGSLDAGQGEAAAQPLPGVMLAGVIRPVPRPARLGGVPAALTSTVSADAPPSVPATEIDAATLTAGTRLVQLGAFDTTDAARAEWDKLHLRFADLLQGKARVVEAAQSGGRTFYRLRAHGFDSDAAARQFCAAFLSAEAACIPVSQR
ncbi:MAG: SPOR domain-containing protein [Gemmobacter sp.]